MNSLEEIKHYITQNFKLEDLIQEDTEVKKSGSRLTACCPFHEENTPSFYIFSDHYHCFGCKAHGDAINYVREKRGLGFLDAIDFLGGKLGIDTSFLRQNKKDKVLWEKKARQEKAFQLTQQFFTNALSSHFGRQAHQYILSRGYTEAQIKEFGFGFALNSPKALCEHLMKMGFKPEELEEFSLCNRNGDEVYDFFRGRLMIPIRDVTGKFIAFAGRALSQDSPQKYKNSRYDKRSFLFGLDHAYKTIRKKGRALVVEGYLDAIRLWSLGLHEAVACQGTALTLEHMNKLKGLSKDVYLVFDGDSAGKQAALRTITDSQKVQGVAFYYVALPEGEDPDSFTKKHGAQALEELLQKAPSLIEFVIRDRFSSTPEQRVPELLREEILPWIKATTDPLERAYFLKKVSEISGLSEDLLRSQLSKPQASQSPKAPQKKEEETKAPNQEPLPPPKEKFHPRPYLKDLIGHLIFSEAPEELKADELRQFFHEKLELPEPWYSFFEELLDSLKESSWYSEGKDLNLLKSSQSPEIKELLENLSEKRGAFKCDDRWKKIEYLILLNEEIHLRNKIQILNSKIQTKSQNKSPVTQEDEKILLQISELHQRIAKLKAPQG